jgi:hypothetical protein
VIETLLARLKAGRRSTVDRRRRAHPDDETLGIGSRFRRDQAPAPDPGHRRRAARRVDASDMASPIGKITPPRARPKLLARWNAGADRRGSGAAILSGQGGSGQLCRTSSIGWSTDLAGMAAVITHPFEHGHPDHDSTRFGGIARLPQLGSACAACDWSSRAIIS